MRIVHFEKGVFPELRRMIIAIMEWVALFLGLLLSADLLGAKYGDWNARRIAIKSERALTATLVSAARFSITFAELPGRSRQLTAQG